MAQWAALGILVNKALGQIRQGSRETKDRPVSVGTKESQGKKVNLVTKVPLGHMVDMVCKEELELRAVQATTGWMEMQATGE